MSTFRIANAIDFGIGNSVSIYAPNLLPGAAPPVTGSAIASATVQSDGYVLLASGSAITSLPSQITLSTSSAGSNAYCFVVA